MRMRAALVTSLPVRARPSSIALCVEQVWSFGDRRADGGCQPFPARWIFRVGTFRLGAAGSRDAASRACRSHATVMTILPRVWPCSTVRRPSAVSARG